MGVDELWGVLNDVGVENTSLDRGSLDCALEFWYPCWPIVVDANTGATLLIGF